jgi:ketosteroid isomerase-like protein
VGGGQYSCRLVSDAADLARRAVQSWNAGDLDGYFAAWDRQIVVRPDPYFPDSEVLVGAEAARRFIMDQLQFMGSGELEIVEEHDLGERSLLRVRQEVEAPASGVRSSYEWSFLATARDGKLVSMDFFIDRERGREAAGVGEEGD